MSFKFFRKYNRIIMVVGGSILMVMFLLPNVDLFQPNAADNVVATINDGEEITQADLQRAGFELGVLRAFASSLVYYNQQLAQSFAPPEFDEDAELYWILLWKNARAQGLYSSTTAIASQLTQIQKELKIKTLAPILNQYKATPEDLYIAIQHLREYQQLIALSRFSMTDFSTFPMRRVSLPHMREVAKIRHAETNVEIVPIDADTLLADIAEPTEEEIKERFNQNKEDKPGDSRFGFGYHQPDHVKLEYLAVDFESVATNLTKVDEVEIVTYYQDNKSEFFDSKFLNPDKEEDKKEGDDANATDKKDDATPEKREPYKPLHMVRDSIHEKLRSKKTAALQTEVIKYIQARLNESQRRLSTDNNGYLVYPADFKPISLKQIAADVQASEQFKGYLPTYIEINKWRSMEDIESLQGFGKATLPTVNNLPVIEYISSTRELNNKDNEYATLKLQQGSPSIPVKDTDQNYYIFRVTDVKPAHVPKSVDEADIRQQVIKDIKRLKAYNKLVETHTEKVMATVKKDGLKKLATDYKSTTQLISGIKLADQIKERGQSAGINDPKYKIVGNSTAFVEAVTKLSDKIELAGGLEKAKPEDTFGIIAIDKNQKLVAFKITEIKPVTQEQFAMLKRMLIPYEVQQLEYTEAAEEKIKPSYSLEYLKKNLNFVDVRPAEKEEDDDTGEDVKTDDTKDAKPEENKDKTQDTKETTPAK